MKIIQSKLILAASIAAIMAGCSGTGDTSALTNTAANKTTGIVASGEIDSFGSVVVDGVHYASDAAEVMVDGESAIETDLDVGMIVDVEATHEDGKPPVAKHIHFFSKVAGAIEAIDATTKTLTINGKTVLITADTHLDKAIDEVTLAPLVVGTKVRVSGHTDTSGNVLASHIGLPKVHLGDRLSGAVADLNTEASTLTIDGKVVNFSNATVKGTLAEGVRIMVRGTVVADVFNAEGELIVITPKIKAVKGEKKKRAAIKGNLKNIHGKLCIDGHPLKEVDKKDVTLGAIDDLQEGEIALVEGEFNDEGDIVVDNIEFDMATTIRKAGVVDSIDLAEGTITVAGEVVEVAAETDFTDKTNAHKRYFNIKDVTVGDTVIVSGHKDKNKKIKATGLELAADKANKPFSGKLHTEIASIEGSTLTTTDGVTVTITDATKIADSVDLTTLVLGENGDELWISGTFGADHTFTATFITSLHLTPTKAVMPHQARPAKEEVKEVKKRIDAIDERMMNEGDEATKDIQKRFKDFGDRFMDTAVAVSEADMAEMVSHFETMRAEMEANMAVPKVKRDAIVGEIEATVTKMKKEKSDVKTDGNVKESNDSKIPTAPKMPVMTPATPKTPA